VAGQSIVKKPQFIIMSYPRTGSTLLCSSLNQHPDLQVGMELFHGCLANCGDDQLLVWREDAFQKLYSQGENDLLHIDVLNRYTLDESRCGGLGDFARLIVEQHNGFKFQYYQLNVASPVWDFYEQEAPELKVIFLERDLLECTLSLRLAQTTGMWQKFNEHEVIADVPQHIDLGHLRKFYRSFCVQEDLYKARFVNSIAVSYDELIGSWESVTERIQKFLGLDVVSLPQHVFKRTSGSLQELVCNYDRIVEGLGGLSPYEYARKRERFLL
jgi:LPS sulfotransferase NodH